MEWEKYVEARSVRVCGLYIYRCALKYETPKLMPSTFCGQWLLEKTEKNDLIGIKIVHETCAGLSWPKLEMQIFHEVEYAIFVQSVLVSLAKGPNTKSVHGRTEGNTSVTL
jgi:hypothetical protein